MSLEARLEAGAPGGPSAVTLGTFDGVHIGHARLLMATRRAARSGGASSVAIVFRQPPRVVLRAELPAPHLCALSERLSLIKQAGVDAVIDVDFTEEVRGLTARQFVEVLRRTLDMRALVMGPGATVGRDRGGDAGALQALGAELGFELTTVEPVTIEGVIVRSTAIRAALATGEVETAAAMLGRRFTVSGIVKEGERRGKSLGFPTANLAPGADTIIPADGIYAAWVTAGGEAHAAAANVGVRPTFDGDTRLLEAYLLDYDGDLYGHRITVEFVQRLRDEVRFESSEALVEQMKRDVEVVRRLLERAPQGG